MRSSQYGIAVVGFVVSFALSTASFLQAARPAREAQREPPVKEIAVQTSLSTTLAHVGDNVRFFLTFTNPTVQGISQIRLRQLRAPGYEIDSLSWCSLERKPLEPDAPKDMLGSSDAVEIDVPMKCSLVADTLKPGQSVTVWGDLRDQKVHGKQALSVVLSWTNLKKVESSLSVPLGEIQSTRWWAEPLSKAVNTIKDLALPILLGLLAYLYQRLEKTRDQARSDQESAREQVRQEQDRLRTQLAETWSKMLPESHRLATRFYMPIEAALQGVLQFVESRQTDQRSYFYLVLFERRMRHLLKSAGGFYFKDRVGEKLAIHCYQTYRNLYYYQDSDKLKRLGAMLDHVSVGETWASFSKKVSENGPAKQPLEDAWNDFGEWLNAGKHVQAMPFLKTFRAVLSYEMNRPYEYWYGRRDTIELDAGIEKTIADIAGKIETEEPSSDFVNKAREYLAKAKS
jgi:hypothetical protein